MIYQLKYATFFIFYLLIINLISSAKHQYTYIMFQTKLYFFMKKQKSCNNKSNYLSNSTLWK